MMQVRGKQNEKNKNHSCCIIHDFHSDDIGFLSSQLAWSELPSTLVGACYSRDYFLPVGLDCFRTVYRFKAIYLSAMQASFLSEMVESRVFHAHE